MSEPSQMLPEEGEKQAATSHLRPKRAERAMGIQGVEVMCVVLGSKVQKSRRCVSTQRGTKPPILATADTGPRAVEPE